MPKQLKPALAAAVLLAWAVLGVYGAVTYAHDYYTFRGFSPPHTPKGVPAGRLLHMKFFSPALGERRSYLIYLPPGYSAAVARGRRFPVFYFLHGSPGWPGLVFDAARIGVAYDVLLHQHRIRPFLMVMPDGRNGTFTSDTEWANTRYGRYESFVLDVVRAVDQRWATIPKRRYRILAGDSEGAYGATNITLHQLKTFGALESWSGYTHESLTSGPFAGEPLSAVEANEPDAYLARVANRVRKLHLRAYLYTGHQDHSAAQVASMASELRAAGAKVTFSVFPGGHNWRVWRDHTPLMLRWASKAFLAKK